MKKEEKEEKEQQVEQQVEQKIQQVSNQELVFKKPQGRPQYSNNTTMKQQQDEKILQSETSPQCTDQRILELGMKVYSTNTPIIKTTRINALNMDTYTINPESQIMFSMFRNKQYPVIESKDFSGVAIKPRLPISSQGQIPEFKFQEINMEEIIDNLNECFLIKQQLSEGISYFIKKSVPNLKTFDDEMNSKDKQIISTKMIYFHQKEIENLMDKMQKMFNQDLSIQFNLYFAFAVMKKLLFSCDFYGEPLVIFELDKFIIANEELQKSYTGQEFNKKNDINNLPYFFNVQSNPCIYRIEQNKQLKIVYEKLNKRLF
ncbi:hypothetical protein TTHERM_01679240 (macronuclear) [Tetrahymena thermophila SB210]|uniref:Uncharacterized protein n=1 Tax=Tetrahymena thermophila (strain SB210) TaxID=312017 RepID=Q24BR3_TETTS|nr:hypothetical protein TTHERM_01679240 [Tetrahymena thermophila SB210]EAS05217.3 hypothetical protein TTHERM_01679240 [Tetrahymena thermophila SB210]|eukprot:XP_001025462.3 hypothetical protein TTHERM_01679240 [Tetrahymena thermophila SB210]